MSLSIGIIGLPNVGKSTLFQAITKKQIDRQNYPFCTIDPNVGVVIVPDERVDKLAELSKSVKKIYTTIEFVDIAGLVKGASKGEGLGNKFLANIREVDTIVYVLRCFKNEKIVNTQPSIDVLRDKEVLDTEMALKDIETLEKRMSGMERLVKAQDKEAIRELKILESAKQYLENGEYLADKEWNEEELKTLNSYQLLTIKPRLFLLNGKKEEIDQSVLRKLKDKNYLILDILSEFDSADLSIEERKEFDLPVELKLNELIKKSYHLLDLITFLTTGSDETRAWTLKKGSRAPQAGGVIHTDFEKQFIKADVINWQKLIEAGGIAKAREQGLMRTEGKDYIVQDGDVIEIKSSA